MLIMPCLETSPIVLEIFVFGDYHPMELIRSLLDKVIEDGILGLDKGSKGCFLLLNGHKGSINFVKIMGGSWMRGIRSSTVSGWGRG